MGGDNDDLQSIPRPYRPCRSGSNMKRAWGALTPVWAPFVIAALAARLGSGRFSNCGHHLLVIAVTSG